MSGMGQIGLFRLNSHDFFPTVLSFPASWTITRCWYPKETDENWKDFIDSIPFDAFKQHVLP